MITLISAIVIFCLIISVHEFGHFITAKIFKVTVHEYSIGMGKKLFGFHKNGTDYSFRLLPIGGYVKLEGEDSESEDPNAFCNKGKFPRFSILFAGAFMNFVLGFLLIMIIFGVSDNNFASNKIDTVIKDSAFYQAGIKPGDEILKLEGENYSTKVSTYSDIAFFNYRNSNNSPINVKYKRDGKVYVAKEISAKYDKSKNRYLYGFSVKPENKTLLSVLKYSYHQSVFDIKIVFFSFIDLLTGNLGKEDVSGPVGIVTAIDSAANDGILTLINLASLLTINLGVMNLLPFPALDGCRILFILIELIFRKPVPREKEGFVHAIGFIILMLFMLYITFFDILKLFN